MLFFKEGGIPMAGRKTKPTAIKKLEGNPGKRKLNTKEPVPVKGMPTCPEWLLPEAKKEWDRLADLMNQIFRQRWISTRNVRRRRSRKYSQH